MYSLILYDTSNFVDFPIGGQLTSIRNFLKYLANFQKKYCDKILLVGITNNKEEVGKFIKVIIDDIEFDFIPVIYREKDLSNVKKSLRVEYVKGLMKYSKLIKVTNNTINYIHTPEAIISLKFKHPFAKYIIFSHGSFFNMIDGFRFYKKNKVMMYLFNKYIIYIIRHAKLIFSLDRNSTTKYLKYNKNVIEVNNSIVVEDSIKPKNKNHNPLKLIFVGRLSKVKNIDNIIKAVLNMEDVILTIVGDGEEKNHLVSLSNNSNKIKFIGAVTPSEVNNYMYESDILVMNSIIEGKPMTIIEALSCRLPVITTNVGGICDMVNNHIDSEITDGSVEGIQNAISLIRKNYKNYSNNAFNNSKKYDFKTINKEIFDIISK